MNVHLISLLIIYLHAPSNLTNHGQLSNNWFIKKMQFFILKW